MKGTVLFAPNGNYFLVGSLEAPTMWVGTNPNALAALYRIVSMPGTWCDVRAFGGSPEPTAMHHRLHNAAKALAHVSPMLSAELRRGLTRKRRKDDGRIVWRYDHRGALVFIETRPK